MNDLRDFTTVVTESLDRRLGFPPSRFNSKPIYSKVGDEHGGWVRNPLSPLRGLKNKGCISPFNTHGGGKGLRGGLVALAPDIVVGAKHVGIAAGVQIVFVDWDNSLQVRTLSYPRNPVADINVYRLDAELPSSIGFAKVLPEDFQRYAPFPFRFPAIGTDQEHKALVFDFNGYVLGGNLFTKPADAKRAAWFEGLVWGDSGNAVGLVVDDEFVAECTWTGGGLGGGGGSSLSYYARDIDAACVQLGSPYQTTPLDLSGFKKY